MKTWAAIFVLLSITITPGILRAQDPAQIPGYLARLKTEKSDTAIIQVYSMLCFHYSMVNTDTAVMYGKKGLGLAEKLEHQVSIANVKNSLGWAYLQMNNYGNAEPLFLEALDTWKQLNRQKEQKVVMSNLGVLYMSKKDYAKSLSYLREVISLDDAMNDTGSKAIDLYNVGRLYNMQKNYLEARKYFQQSYALHKQMNNELLMSEVLMSIGNTYQYEGNYRESLKYYEQVAPVFKKLNNAKRLGLTYENSAGSYALLKDYSAALRYYSLAEEQYNSLHSKADLYYVLIGKGDVYLQMNDDNRAKTALLTALQYAQEMNDPGLQYEVMKSIADVQMRQGDYRSATAMLLRSAAIKDSLFTLEKQQELLKLQTQFETERKEKENELLKAQNAIASATLQRNNIFLVAAIAGLLLLGGLLYMIYKNKEGKAKHIRTLESLNKQLQEQKEEISRINIMLQLKALRAQMNPHFIFNCMSSIQECILLGQVDDANKYLSKLSRLLRMVLLFAEAESISLDKELEMLELYLELEKVRLQQQFRFVIQVDETLFSEEVMVPTLILQPFAENAIWHGLMHKPADRLLHIRITADQECLLCSIEDNGIGRVQASVLMQHKKHHQSKGLTIIEERLDIIRQRSGVKQTGFVITDQYTGDGQPAGTAVFLTLPLSG